MHNRSVIMDKSSYYRQPQQQAYARDSFMANRNKPQVDKRAAMAAKVR